MAVNVTNTDMSLNTDTAFTANAATADSNDLAEAFTFTPGATCQKYLIMTHHDISAGTATYSIAIGAGHPAAALAAKTGSIVNAVEGIMVDGSYLSATGTIVITYTPASGKKLKTDHALVAYGVVLP